MDNKTFEELLEAGEIELILADSDGDLESADLTPEQKNKILEKSKEQSANVLQKRAMEIAAQPGYQDFMTLPLMSKMFKSYTSQSENTPKPEGYQYNMGANGRVGGQKEAEDNRPSENIAYEKDKQDKKLSVNKKDPEVTIIGPGSQTKLRAGDSAGDILAKMFNLYQKTEKWEKKKQKRDKKYRKELDDQRERHLEETIEALSGKRPSAVGRMVRKARRSGFMKYGLAGAGVIGSFFLAEKALAKVDWKSLLPDFKLGQEPTYTPNATSARNSAEKYLGRSMSDTEWDELIRATSAESGAKSNLEEQARIMATILNRARDANETIPETLRKKNAFQAVTGTEKSPGPSKQFTEGPSDERKNDIMSAAENILPDVPKQQKHFAAADPNAYKEGTNPKFKDSLKGGQSGGTVFEVPMPEKRTASPVKDMVITSEQGKRISPNTGELQDHKGIDIRGGEGQDVLTVAKGIVSRVKDEPGFGTTVVVDHGNGVRTTYRHLKNPSVKVGDEVQRAQKLAEIGPKVKGTTAPHLHFEVHKDNQTLQAKNYLTFNPVAPKFEVWNDKDSTIQPLSKRAQNSKGNKISVLTNTTNVMNGGTSYNVSQNDVNDNSDLFNKTYNRAGN